MKTPETSNPSPLPEISAKNSDAKTPPSAESATPVEPTANTQQTEPTITATTPDTIEKTISSVVETKPQVDANVPEPITQTGSDAKADPNVPDSTEPVIPVAPIVEPEQEVGTNTPGLPNKTLSIETPDTLQKELTNLKATPDYQPIVQNNLSKVFDELIKTTEEVSTPQLEQKQKNLFDSMKILSAELPPEQVNSLSTKFSKKLDTIAEDNPDKALALVEKLLKAYGAEQSEIALPPLPDSPSTTTQPEQPKVETPKTLVCFDFDQTIVNGHFYKELKKENIEFTKKENGIITEKDYTPNPKITGMVDQLLTGNDNSKDPMEGFKNPQQLKATFDKLLEDGHEIAITSFTKYPDIIRPTLEKLGLTKEQLDKITVVGGFPSDGDGSPNGKLEHMLKAMELKGVENPANVLLIDDSPDNIKAAKDWGFNAIKVPNTKNPDPSEYLNNSTNKEANVVNTASDMKSKALEGKNQEVITEINLPHAQYVDERFNMRLNGIKNLNLNANLFDTNSGDIGKITSHPLENDKNYKFSHKALDGDYYILGSKDDLKAPVKLFAKGTPEQLKELSEGLKAQGVKFTMDEKYTVPKEEPAPAPKPPKPPVPPKPQTKPEDVSKPASTKPGSEAVTQPTSQKPTSIDDTDITPAKTKSASPEVKSDISQEESLKTEEKSEGSSLPSGKAVAGVILASAVFALLVPGAGPIIAVAWLLLATAVAVKIVSQEVNKRNEDKMVKPENLKQASLDEPGKQVSKGVDKSQQMPPQQSVGDLDKFGATRLTSQQRRDALGRVDQLTTAQRNALEGNSDYNAFKPTQMPPPRPSTPTPPLPQTVLPPRPTTPAPPLPQTVPPPRPTTPAPPLPATSPLATNQPTTTPPPRPATEAPPLPINLTPKTTPPTTPPPPLPASVTAPKPEETKPAQPLAPESKPAELKTEAAKPVDNTKTPQDKAIQLVVPEPKLVEPATFPSLPEKPSPPSMTHEEGMKPVTTIKPEIEQKQPQENAPPPAAFKISNEDMASILGGLTSNQIVSPPKEAEKTTSIKSDAAISDELKNKENGLTH